MARGSIRQRSKVRKDSWTVQVYLGPDPVTGKKRYHSEAVRGSKAQAQRRLTELQRELDIGVFTRPSQMTVREYLEQWCRDYAETHVRRRTFEGYRGILDQYILPKLGAVALAKLTPRHVLEMESALLREGGEKDQGLSPQTVLHVHRVLSSALKNAVKLGMVARNVAGAVEPPRVTRQETRTLTWEEVYQLLEQVADPLYWTLILLDIQTGLRRSEILGLQWRDVDLPSGTLSVRRAWIKLPSGGMELTVPKSGRARVVALPGESVELLRSHGARQREAAVGNGDFVFCRSDGNPLDPDWVTQGFRRMADKAGLENFRFHDLRHTHASLMLAEGVHLKVTSERLGHSSIGITGNLYSHVQPTVQREAVERFGAAWRTGMADRMANSDSETENP
jgi:integrase